MGGKQAPELTDAQTDHGSSDGEVFTAIKKGVPPTMMAGWEGRISDTEIWNIVNYLRALAANPNLTVASTAAAPAAPSDAAARHWSWRISSRCRSPATPAASSHAACCRA